MGYDNERKKPVNWGGSEEQIRRASSTLKSALEEENVLYGVCNGKNEDKKVKCILSVYNSGKPLNWRDSFSVVGVGSTGGNYAKAVMGYWENWNTYFLG